MEISNYDIYHIGTKLNSSVDIERLRQVLIAELPKKKYFLQPRKNILEGLTLPLLNPTEIIATKESVKIEINYPLNALNVIGENPQKVYQSFEEVISILETIKEYELSRVITLYEILARAVIPTTKKPLDMLKDHVTVKLDCFDAVGGGQVYGLTIRGPGLTPEDGVLQLTLEPHPNSPNKNFLLQVLRQVKNIDEIKSFPETIKNSLQKLFS